MLVGCESFSSVLYENGFLKRSNSNERWGGVGDEELAVGVKTKSDDFAFSNNFYRFFGKMLREMRRKRGKSLCGKQRARKRDQFFVCIIYAQNYVIKKYTFHNIEKH